tara:strand:- start:625 stop:831 length:207 start_codon:yes stop_codon:yes gene_type:complete
MFSLPLIIILIDKKKRRQKAAQYPINLPPIKTILCGKKKDGIKIIEIKIIPVKKKKVNKIFLIILIKS